MNTDKSLYPLKFKPVLKERIWGGARLKTVLGKKATMEHCGESWELSGVPGDVSVVANGFLQGNSLQELIEIYMGDLVGDRIYSRFGVEFPILVKFIDAQDDLSIQVHPDDRLAAERHGAYGKTEMWYVMEAGRDSSLIAGFNQRMDREKYMQALKDKKLKDIMNFEKVAPGDVFFIPAGRVHAIGKDILLAEIQQTSDVTYRIYDWDRVDAAGKPRELHTELALDAIDYSLQDEYRTRYRKPSQESVELVSCPYFTTSLVCLEQPLEKDYQNLDSFVIYICTSGACSVRWGTAESMDIRKGDTLLVPAVLDGIRLIPSESTELLEVCAGNR
ncbi:MAG: class I mannose-6-phosphate isomerase [Bacteroidales bacterium]|nr:class I mannose-6-phosphate isomerase [Bacteroidales bacterium]